MKVYNINHEFDYIGKELIVISKSKLLDIRIAFENILYEQTTDDITKDDAEQIRELVNTSLSNFIKENNIN